MADQQDIWIFVPNWGKFQHYRDRRPPWVKTYTDLLDRDEYLALSSHQRGVLHGIWLAYASSDRHLRANTVTLSRRLNVRVSTQDIERLNRAGFIETLASNVLAERLQDASSVLAERLQPASPRVRPRARGEAETEEPYASNRSLPKAAPSPVPESYQPSREDHRSSPAETAQSGEGEGAGDIKETNETNLEQPQNDRPSADDYAERLIREQAARWQDDGLRRPFFRLPKGIE